jgi:8-oxo-dGTP pyrophosphatase MutT (NUDIX family)
MHYIQTQILKKLLFVPQGTFSELIPSGLESNLFNFHLKELIKLKYVIKDNEGSYLLSIAGKEYANAMETETLQIARQGKLCAVSCARRNTPNGLEWLIYTRSKHPFWGFQGFPSGKARYGESMAEAAIREFGEETGLTGVPQIKAIQHYVVVPESGDVAEDKYFFLFLFSNPTGDLKANDEGSFEWINEKDLKKKITKPFYGFWDLFNQVSKNTKEITFGEEVQHVKEF